MDIDKLLNEQSGIRLDIGCGASKQPGWTGMDIRCLPGVDIVWNVTEFPWPLPNECVLCAIASHLVEHIAPHNFGFINFMNEVWRVMKPGGEFAIATPHGYSPGYLQDPTHCNPCNEATWAYFDPEEPNTGGGLWRIYQPKPWKIKSLSWDPSANIEVVLAKRGLDNVAHHFTPQIWTFGNLTRCAICGKPEANDDLDYHFWYEKDEKLICPKCYLPTVMGVANG